MYLMRRPEKSIGSNGVSRLSTFLPEAWHRFHSVEIHNGHLAN